MSKTPEKIIDNYTKTLFELCPDGRRSDYLGYLKKWQEVFNDAPEVLQLLMNPAFYEEERNQLIADVLKEIAPEEEILKNFFIELANNRRLGDLPQIIALYTDYLYAEQGVKAVQVVSAFEIVDEEKRELTEAIEKTLQAKTVIKWDVDESLIGGLVIKIDDAVIDNSIKGALKNIKQELLA